MEREGVRCIVVKRGFGKVIVEEKESQGQRPLNPSQEKGMVGWTYLAVVKSFHGVGRSHSGYNSTWEESVNIPPPHPQ